MSFYRNLLSSTEKKKNEPLCFTSLQDGSLQMKQKPLIYGSTRISQVEEELKQVRAEFLATLFSASIPHINDETGQPETSYYFVSSQCIDNSYLFLDFPEEKFQAISFWWQGIILHLSKQFPKDHEVFDEVYFYRGMPFIGKDGVKMYASARDIGNIAAGIVAKKGGLSWKVARFGFDSYQTYSDLNIINKIILYASPASLPGIMISNWEKEGITTQNAQLYGYKMY